jgi:hypothetical protein
MTTPTPAARKLINVDLPAGLYDLLTFLLPPDYRFRIGAKSEGNTNTLMLFTLRGDQVIFHRGGPLSVADCWRLWRAR